MKIQTLLYYRYLTRQTLLVWVISFIISLIVCLCLLLTNIMEPIISIVIASVVWLYPLYVSIILLVWTVNFWRAKSECTNKELFNNITNSVVRERVLKSGAKIKYLIPIKDQEKSFFEAVQPEIEKQKKLLAIKEGRY